MIEVIGLVLPFFGLILIGAFTARIVKRPLDALGWLNIFVLYIALPALFFQILSRTPIDKLTEWRFVFGVVLSTYIVFAILFAGAIFASAGNIAQSTIKALAAAYGNIGYMGPGIALLALGPEAAVPVALIFCFENILHFTVAPLMMGLSGGRGRLVGYELAWEVAGKIALHPFIIATALGIGAAAVGFAVPLPLDRLLSMLAEAAAPCALFAMGVTLALRPVTRVPRILVPIVLLKLIVHPALCYVILSLLGDFSPVWVYSAVLLAALPTATNVYVIAQQYGVWVERASACVLVTTVASVFTVTALLYGITSGLLPADLFPKQ